MQDTPQYFDLFFYEKLGTSLIFGSKVDEQSDHIFLPFELFENLKEAKFNNQLLCKASKNILSYEKLPPELWWNSIFTYLIFLLLVIIAKNTYLDNLFFLVLGVVGFVFTFAGLYSFHKELANNYNILLLNPSLLVLIYFVWAKNKKWIVNFCYLNLAMLAIYVAIVFDKIHFWIVLPLVIVSGFILLKQLRLARKI